MLINRLLIYIIVSLVFYFSGIRTHRRNYFVEGTFSGINVKNENETVFLIVKEISKKEYQAANGIDVVKDEYKKNYFLLTCYYENEEGTNYYHFVNLKSYGTPISYEDNNKSRITPFHTDSYKQSDPQMYNVAINNGYENNLSWVRLYEVEANIER